MADQAGRPVGGATLAGYRIERRLGRGGMSVVYLAEDLALERKVALKILAPELSEDARFRERFRLESRLAARSTIRTSSRSTKPARLAASSTSRCATSKALTCAGSRRGCCSRARPGGRARRPSRRRARGGSQPWTRPSGRQALERADREPRRARARLPRRLRADEDRRERGRGAGGGPTLGDDRLRRSGARHRGRRGQGRRRVRARLRPLRDAHRAGAVSAELGARDPCRAHRRARAEALRDATRAPRALDDVVGRAWPRIPTSATRAPPSSRQQPGPRCRPTVARGAWRCFWRRPPSLWPCGTRDGGHDARRRSRSQCAHNKSCDGRDPACGSREREARGNRSRPRATPRGRGRRGRALARRRRRRRGLSTRPADLQACRRREVEPLERPADTGVGRGLGLARRQHPRRRGSPHPSHDWWRVATCDRAPGARSRAEHCAAHSGADAAGSGSRYLDGRSVHRLVGGRCGGRGSPPDRRRTSDCLAADRHRWQASRRRCRRERTLGRAGTGARQGGRRQGRHANGSARYAGGIGGGRRWRLGSDRGRHGRARRARWEDQPQRARIGTARRSRVGRRITLAPARRRHAVQARPRNGETLAVEKVGNNAVALSVGEGSVWVAVRGGRQLERSRLPGRLRSTTGFTLSIPLPCGGPPAVGGLENWDNCRNSFGTS